MAMMFLRDAQQFMRRSARTQLIQFWSQSLAALREPQRWPMFVIQRGCSHRLSRVVVCYGDVLNLKKGQQC